MLILSKTTDNKHFASRGAKGLTAPANAISMTKRETHAIVKHIQKSIRLQTFEIPTQHITRLKTDLKHIRSMCVCRAESVLNDECVCRMPATTKTIKKNASIAIVAPRIQLNLICNSVALFFSFHFS